ncbi:MAG: 30S ribosomal protein S6 [Candidatus Berkelbacteria bacterium]
MRKYELTYLVSDQVPEADLKKATSKVDGFIKEFGGKVEKEEIWGRRKLAYPIRKMEFANYITLYFEMPAAKIREFEFELHHYENVIRHLLIVNEYEKEALTLTKDEIAGTEEIEAVIGSDAKEQITGEEKTEEVEPVVAEAEVKTPKVAKKAAEEVAAETEPVKEVKTVKKAAVKKVVKKATKEEESERLTELNKQIEDILSDEL